MPCTVVCPPDGAEPNPYTGEQPAHFALRAAYAKALSLFPVLYGEEAFCADAPGCYAANTPLCFASKPLPKTEELSSPEMPLFLAAQGVLEKAGSLSHQATLPHFTAQGLLGPYPLAIRPRIHHAIVAADTVVALEGCILGKPVNETHALAMLASLAGKRHEVFTGCVLITPFGSCAFAVQTGVTMWPATQEVLQRYVATGEPQDKAGAYAVQGAGAFLVASVHGSWSNVVGLPLAEVVQVLVQYGVLV